MSRIDMPISRCADEKLIAAVTKFKFSFYLTVMIIKNMCLPNLSGAKSEKKNEEDEIKC